MKKTAELYGLVLCGGKSSRMGRDKALLQYHHLPQTMYMGNLLSAVGCTPMLSLRKEQTGELSGAYPVIEDALDIPGPLNGMLSAHRAYPERAFLVVAADMPLLKEDTLEYLIRHRNPNCVATVFLTGDKALPEPLCAIWEPQALALMLPSGGSKWGYSPKRFLEQHKFHGLTLPREDALINVNTPQGYEKVKTMLKNKNDQRL